MDGGAVHPIALASLSKYWDKSVCSNIDSDFPGMFGAYASRVEDRDFNGINQPERSVLALGLGPLSSTTTSGCSPSVSLDLGLSINLDLGVSGTYNPKKVLAGSSSGGGKPAALDLHLSLSTGAAESDVTTVTQEFLPSQKISDSLVLAPEIQLLDEGSTSSRWKKVPSVLPLKTQPALCSSLLKQDCSVSELSIPSTAAVPPCSLSNASKRQQRKSNVKTCQFEGCSRGARGASGHCIAHGGGRRCQKAGCEKGAEGKTVFCKAHGGGRRCQHLGCTRSAEGRTDFCIGHGGGRRCSQAGCVRAARGKSGLCIRHGGGKRCKVDNCTKSAEGVSGLCISHGGGRRCQFPKCTKGAQGSTVFCKAHGGGRRCTFLGCTKGAEGSTPFCKGHGGGKRCASEGCTKSVHGGTLFCVGHGGGKRCAVPDCTKSARGRTSFCVRHGGGKRCKFEGCPKSAQGSTDFCKAHGGGRRCTWGQLYSGEQDPSHCDKFARGKSGLCSAHSAQVQGKFQGTASLNPRTSYSLPGTSDNRATSTASVSLGHQSNSLPVTAQINFAAGASCLDQLSLPEGRVHGGSLMAMLAKGKTN